MKKLTEKKLNEMCDKMYKLASEVMEMRQEGIVFSDMIKSDYPKELVVDAYLKPVFEHASLKQSSIKVFAETFTFEYHKKLLKKFLIVDPI